MTSVLSGRLPGPWWTTAGSADSRWGGTWRLEGTCRWGDFSTCPCAFGDWPLIFCQFDFEFFIVFLCSKARWNLMKQGSKWIHAETDNHGTCGTSSEVEIKLLQKTSSEGTSEKPPLPLATKTADGLRGHTSKHYLYIFTYTCFYYLFDLMKLFWPHNWRSKGSTPGSYRGDVEQMGTSELLESSQDSSKSIWRQAEWLITHHMTIIWLKWLEVFHEQTSN